MATLKTLLETLHESTELSNPGELKEAIELIMAVQAMDAAQRDVLAQTFKRGPVWDGDIVSGSARDSLLPGGFVAMVLRDGEEGHTACTYKGARAYRLIKAGACA